MATITKLPDVASRFPSLRFYSAGYKFLGALTLAGGLLVAIGALFSSSGIWSGVVPAFGALIAAGSASGLFWVIGEGIEVVLAIEENTRYAALKPAPQAPATSPTLDLSELSTGLIAVSRTLEQVALLQQQTNQRLDALGGHVRDLERNLDTTVRAVETIAESSKATATILYRQGINRG